MQQSSSVTLPPMPPVWNPFGAPRQWTPGDGAAPALNGYVNGSAAAPAARPLRLANSALLPAAARHNPFAFMPRWEGAAAAGAPAAPAEQDPGAADQGLRRATSVTLPPMAPVWNPFAGAARWSPENGVAARAAQALPAAAAGGPRAPPAPSEPAPNAGGAARPGSGPGAAEGSRSAPGPLGPGAPGRGAASRDAIAEQSPGLVACVPGPPPPPPALPFLARTRDPFEPGPGEGPPALPPLWPSPTPPAPPPPALPFIAYRARSFDPEEGSPGVRDGMVRGSAARLRAGDAVADAAGRPAPLGEPGGLGGSLTPSAAPPSSPPAALPFVGCARRSFNRHDSNDSTAGELPPVLPLLLPAQPQAPAPGALPFAAQAAAGFPPRAGDAGGDAPVHAGTAQAEPTQVAVGGRLGADEAAAGSASVGSVGGMRGALSEIEAPHEAAVERAAASGAADERGRAGVDADLAPQGGGGGSSSGGKAAGRAGSKEGLEMPACHPLWLTFENAAIEEKFRIWHSAQMSKVRACAVAGRRLRICIMPLSLTACAGECRSSTGRWAAVCSRAVAGSHAAVTMQPWHVLHAGALYRLPAPWTPQLSALCHRGRPGRLMTPRTAHGTCARRWTPSMWASPSSSSCGWASASRTAWRSTRRSRTRLSWRSWAPCSLCSGWRATGAAAQHPAAMPPALCCCTPCSVSPRCSHRRGDPVLAVLVGGCAVLGRPQLLDAPCHASSQLGF